ncbi:MAG TPA: hypothetical protein PLT66_01805 [Bacillota bacterium]|nr:hypothetical protein [Bacillota bacterium]
MMHRKIRPQTDADWELYEKGKEYNFRLDLYEKAAKNERFYRSEQWKGIEDNGLPTPVFNLFKRIIGYYISNILSDATSMRYSASLPQGLDEKELESAAVKVNDAAQARWDKLKMDDMLADALLDAALTGDAVSYTYWDPSERTGQPFEGDFVTKLVDSTNVFFGDPNCKDVQKQPYILISARELVDDVRAQAARSRRTPEEAALIVPDSDVYTQSGDYGLVELENTKCTTLVKLYRDKDGFICFRKITKDAVVTDDVSTGLRLYPVCFFNWTKIKNSWHGESAAAGMIENQVFINKAFAMVMKHMMDTAFSKFVYDSTVIEDWSNKVGEAIAVNGSVDSVAKVLQSGSMQSGILEVISMAISQTKEFMGATDAALGDVDPRNTSAIIAMQEASAMPLQNVRRQLYRFIEDLGMIWLDFMMRYYDSRRLIPVSAEETTRYESFDAKKYMQALFRCRIDVGATGYYSEVTTLNALDSLLNGGHIDLVQYLERLPQNIIPKKRELVDEIKIKQTKELTQEK